MNRAKLVARPHYAQTDHYLPVSPLAIITLLVHPHSV